MDKFIDYSLDDGIETIYELLHAENSDNVRQFLKEVNTTRNNNNYLNHRIKFRNDTDIFRSIQNVFALEIRFGPDKHKKYFVSYKRIKPTPQTPKEKHKYCTMNSYFTMFQNKAGFLRLLLV